MFVKQTGNKNATIRIIWLHGWRLDHNALLQLSELFQFEAENYLIDLPGFGLSDVPPTAWGTIDYANQLIAWLQKLPPKKTYLIGHSFGGKIAIQTAQLQSTIISGIILIAASGLKQKRTMFFKIKATILKSLGQCLRIIDKYLHTTWKEKYSRNFGSSDYKATRGIMRAIFVKIIHEDLTNIAAQINIPTLLIYGEKDQETPVQLGSRYNNLIANSKFFVLPEFDHYNILSTGRHQVYNLIANFIIRE